MIIGSSSTPTGLMISEDFQSNVRLKRIAPQISSKRNLVRRLVLRRSEQETCDMLARHAGERRNQKPWNDATTTY